MNDDVYSLAMHLAHEVLRDGIIFASMVAVLAFYSWLIPPPLHGAADPYAQAGFVFPDWYVLFSYGYLRWGEYLPQFDIPAGPIGEFFGQPVIAWNAAWWGAAITGLPSEFSLYRPSYQVEKAWSGRPMVCHRRSHLFGTRMVHQCILNQHLP